MGRDRMSGAIVAQGLWSGASFFLAVGLARLLAPDAFGWFAVIIAAKQLAVMLLGALVLTPLTVLWGDRPTAEARPLLLHDSLRLVGRSGVGGLGVAVVITAVTGWPAVEVGIFVLGGVIVELQRRINFLQGRAWPDVIGGGVMVGTALAIPAVLALADAPSVYQAVGALGLVQIVWVTATGWRDWTRAFGDGNAMTAWGDLWRVGRWGLASNAAGYAYSYASLFLTLGLIGTTGVAVLELAQQMVTPVQVVMLGMANVWHPVLARAAGVDHPRDFVRVLRRAVWVQTGVGAIVLVTLLVSGPSLVSLLVPGKETLYSGVPSVAWVLGLAVLGQLVWQHPSFAIVALGKPQYGFATRLGTAASVLPLGYLLTAHFGVMGAAWTRAIGEVMVACLSVLILHEVLRSREQCVVMEPNPVGSVR